MPNPPQTLTVARAGSGTGTVTGLPPGIDCGSTCSHGYPGGTDVRLTATAAAGSTFTGWSGDCSGTGACTLTMSAAHAATATFESDKTLMVTKSGTGSGTVNSSPAGITSGSTCSRAYAHGTMVSLTAAASSRSQFAGWSGDCSGKGACNLAMSADHVVSAHFQAKCIVPKEETASPPASASARRRVPSSPWPRRPSSPSRPSSAPSAKVGLVVSKGKKRR
ncbi:MAG TPA: hypothetical protein VMG74_11920 [Gaiellaceae bacterium]|nr:hypothetical protein [Gaiellaceae bacterium]